MYIPQLGEIYFPDINGIWDGKIIFENSTTGNEEQLMAHARIRQNLWSVYIDLSSSTSNSHTLVAYPTIEAGNKKLYYIYHNVPQNPRHPEYKGSTILDVKVDKNGAHLSGSYFTIRKTVGRIELKRINNDPNEQLSR